MIKSRVARLCFKHCCLTARKVQFLAGQHGGCKEQFVSISALWWIVDLPRVNPPSPSVSSAPALILCNQTLCKHTELHLKFLRSSSLQKVPKMSGFIFLMCAKWCTRNLENSIWWNGVAIKILGFGFGYGHVSDRGWNAVLQHWTVWWDWCVFWALTHVNIF